MNRSESSIGVAASAASAITRTIDASQYFRPFPALAAYRNTSTQKVPAPALAHHCAQQLGRAKITRCWLNLDEMWDYRTGQYDYNYRIGARKYDDVPDKFNDSWAWASESHIHFDDYLRAFSAYSDEILLTIRRYERDVLDGKIGVTMRHWRQVFKDAVVHAKQVCPNLRYVEACNEYNTNSFINCTAGEYYGFYRAAYQAVNEANTQLGLAGDRRILVGGPVALDDHLSDLVKEMTLFMENFRDDPSPDKRLDFLSWHEYHHRLSQTVHREAQFNAMLRAHGQPASLPMFITEHDPYHPHDEAREYNLINGAALARSLYFTSRFSPNVHIMPWVLYHDGRIQTRFMWFDGPNEPDTPADAFVMLPAGGAMRLLSMHKQWEVAVDNNLYADHLVLASVRNDGLIVQAVNHGPTRDVCLRINGLAEVFTALGEGGLRVVKYLIDADHSNHVNHPEYPGGVEEVGRDHVRPDRGSVLLEHAGLSRHGTLLWQLIPQKIGAELKSPAVPSAVAGM